MIKRLFLVLAFTVALPLQAQSSRQVAYFELFGNGGAYSVNYEREWRPALFGRVGAAAWTSEDLWSDNEVSVVAVPLMVEHLSGRGNHHFEAGGGLLLGTKSDAAAEHDGPFATLTGVIGYRFQRPERGFVFRAGVTPFVGLGSGDAAYPDEGLTVSIGLSAGYSF